MDTILNLGLNDDVVAAMIAGNPDPASRVSYMIHTDVSSRCSQTLLWK